MTAKRKDLYEVITSKLIAAIENNPGDPVMPWRRRKNLMMPINAVTQKAYNGVNIVALWMAAEERGFMSSQWATYQQWRQIGAQVKEGSKGETIVFYKSFQVEPDPEKENDDGTRRTLRSFTVFNASQVEGFEEEAPPPPMPPLQRIEAVERFIANTGAHIIYGGDRAYYCRSTDHIQMPDEALFTGTSTMSREEALFSVLLHELAHFSGGNDRLNREFGKKFGDQSYCFEELVAEISTCILMSELGITAEMRPDHAQYLSHWLSILKQDKRAIFSAAAKASEAVNYLKSLQIKAKTDTSIEPLAVAA